MEMLFPLLIFLFLFLYRQFRNFTKAKNLKDIAPFVNGEVVVRPFSAPRIQGNYMGISFRMSFFAESRNSPGRMQIRLDFPYSFAMDVVPKGQKPVLEEIFVKDRSITTGEDSFNDAVSTRVHREREKAMLFLDNSLNRSAILDVFKSGFQSMRFSEKGVVLAKPGDFLGKEGLKPEQALEFLTLAGKLVQRV